MRGLGPPPLAGLKLALTVPHLYLSEKEPVNDNHIRTRLHRAHPFSDVAV